MWVMVALVCFEAPRICVSDVVPRYFAIEYLCNEAKPKAHREVLAEAKGVPLSHISLQCWNVESRTG